MENEKTVTEKRKLFFEAIQALLTCCAILATAWWFLLSAEAKGKANCTQKLSMVQMASNHTNLWWCSLEVKMENVGKRSLKLTNARIIVECIQPQTNGFQLNLEVNDKWGKPVFDHGKKNYVIDSYILPGETDYEYFEFTMPTNIQIFKVYSYISRTKCDDYGWTKNSVYKIEGDQVSEIPKPDK